MNDKTGKAPNKSPRHRARELALQGLYQWRVAGSSVAQIEQTTLDEKSVGRFDTALFSQLLHGVEEQFEDLSARIAPNLDRPVDELSPIEFSVLLLATFELLNQVEVPYRVIINEAIELAKTFGGSDGYKFVNGVLDKLAAQLRQAEIASKA
jgi:N utilization substance protein B